MRGQSTREVLLINAVVKAFIGVSYVVAVAVVMAFYVLSEAAKAPSLILNPKNELFQKDKAPTVIKVNNVDYLRSKCLASNRKATSTVWRFGEKVVRRSDKNAFFYCYECEDRNKEQQLVPVVGTSNVHHHLRATHRRDADTGEIIGGLEAQKKDSDLVKSFISEHSLSNFKALLIRWFVVCQLAFSMLENDVFRDLITFLSAALAAWLPKARSTLRGWIIDEYMERKEVLKAELQASISKISIAFDIWTASNWIGVICIWAYWMDDGGMRQRRLLAFRRIYRSHSVENQAAIILEVLKEYSINEAQKIGWFVSDNASSNDATIAKVLKALEPAISEGEILGRRLRCLGHIINLSARSLLDPTASECAVAASELDIDDITSADPWHSNGPIGKLHKLIRYVLASPQRREEFSEVKGGRNTVEFDHLGVSQCFLIFELSRCGLRES